MAPSPPPPDTPARQVNGGRFDFDDGGTYCGGWEDGKAHGHGVCTGPKAQGEYSGSWHYGFEVSGVYTWPSGSTYEGHWQNGRRHGLGVETRGRWVYRGEWTQGFKGRYGVRQSTTSSAKYEGTWANGLQDGYGSETYADSGTYQGQWQRGSRHGYGVRTSAAFGTASTSKNKSHHHSASSLKSDRPADPTSERDRRVNDTRGGFVLKMGSDEPPARRGSMADKSTTLRQNILQGLRLRKQRSTGDLEKRKTNKDGSVRSTNSSVSWMSTDSAKSHISNGSFHTESNASFVVEDEQMDTNVTETYMGEWKNDRRIGYGVCERSDGLKYEGEWYNNKKYGYGVTTFRDGTREEGKYKNNVLVTSNKKKHMFLMRSAKFRERIDAAVSAASRGSKIALQKADIAISRTATARGKAEQADVAAQHAREDSGQARVHAKQFAPDFLQPGTEGYKSRLDVSGAGGVGETEVPQYRLMENPPHETPKQPPPPPLPPNGIPPGMDMLGFEPPPEPMGGRRLSAAIPHQAPVSPPSNPAPAAAPVAEGDAVSVDYFPAALSNRTSVDRGGTSGERERPSSRRSRPSLQGVPAMNDRFEHYKRAPSRERSVDPMHRSTRKTPQPQDLQVNPSTSPSARAPLLRPDADCTPDSGVSEMMDDPAAESSRFFIPETPEQAAQLHGTGAGGMKRTESMFMRGPQGRRGGTPSLTTTTLQRKKSMPDPATLPVKARVMPREEANFLAATQREMHRQQAEQAAMYRANPLLYVCNPQVKDWFSRQRLVLAVMILNISLAAIFLKLLT